MSKTNTDSVRERRKYLKSVNRCTVCGGQDAFTLNGKSRCAECVQKATSYAYKHRHESTDAQEIARKASEKYRNSHREQGLCTECSRMAMAGRTLCGIHRRNTLIRIRRYKGIPKYILGTCRHCGAECKDGYKYCEKCLPAKQAQAANLRKFISPENQWWRKDNNIVFMRKDDAKVCDRGL